MGLKYKTTITSISPMALESRYFHIILSDTNDVIGFQLLPQGEKKRLLINGIAGKIPKASIVVSRIQEGKGGFFHIFVKVHDFPKKREVLGNLRALWGVKATVQIRGISGWVRPLRRVFTEDPEYVLDMLGVDLEEFQRIVHNFEDSRPRSRRKLSTFRKRKKGE